MSTHTIDRQSDKYGRYGGLTWGGMVRRDWTKHWELYLLMVPVMAFYFLWMYGPMYGITIAFKDFSPRKGIMGSPWIGFVYFKDFFSGPFAWRVIRNTFLISFWNLVFGFPLPIALALMMNELWNMKFKRIVQTITYMPYFISLVVICGILVDFSASDGVFGAVSELVGGKPTNLLAAPEYFRAIYVGSELWQRLGWNSIIFCAALAAINPELYEAATIDGAGRLRQVFIITLPSILPTIAILLILRVGTMMSVGFEKIILLYNGLTYETADVIASYVYRKGIQDANFSFATAVGLFNSVVNFALVVSANYFSARVTETSLF
jgi:putative aldouronate transport system permease protein